MEEQNTEERSRPKTQDVQLEITMGSAIPENPRARAARLAIHANVIVTPEGVFRTLEEAIQAFDLKEEVRTGK